MNPLYGPAGLAMLAEGRAPAEVVAALTAADADVRLDAAADLARLDGGRPGRGHARHRAGAC